MPCPVREGQSLYVDKPAVVITFLPPELGGVAEVELSSEVVGKSAARPPVSAAAAGVAAGTTAWGGGGGVAGGLLTGIMAQSKDKGMSGVRSFLTFTLDRPAVVSSS